MHAQQATRDAESQAMQLAEWLKQAMQQLGVDITPLKSPLLMQPGGALAGRGAVRLTGGPLHMRLPRPALGGYVNWICSHHKGLALSF